MAHIGRQRLSPQRERRAGIAKGIIAIVTAVFLLSFSDALFKLVNERLTIGQLFLARSLVAAALITAFAVLGGKTDTLSLQNSRWVMLRSAFLTGMWACYYVALPAMSLALASAALYTAPLMMALFSSMLLREPVGCTRWIAILIGLLGVYLLLDPDTEALSPVTILPFVAAAFYALAAITTWSRCSGEAPLAMALNLNLCLAVAGAAALVVMVWSDPADFGGLGIARPDMLWPRIATADWLLIGLLGVFMVIIPTAVAKAYQHAPSPVIGVFDNAYLAFAVIWSALFFNEFPNARGVIGIVLIALAAVLTLVPIRAPTKQE